MRNPSSKTLQVKFENITERIGSIGWLCEQHISLNLGRRRMDGKAIRVADLLINGMVLSIAADGAYRFDCAHIWRLCPGYYEVFIESDLEKPVCGVALTPDAIQLVHRIATLGCSEFKKWLKEYAPEVTMDIVLLPEMST